MSTIMQQSMTLNGTQVVVPSENRGASPPTRVKLTPWYTDDIRPTVECLAVDWLELAFTNDLAWLEPYIKHGDFEFKEGTRSRTWKRIYTVYHKGEKFGMLKTNPTSTQAIKGNQVNLKIDNSWLYTDFRQPIFWFTHDTGSDFSHVSRFDIAGDGKNILHPLNCWLQGKIHRMSAGGGQMTYCKATVNSYAEINCDYHRLGSPESEKFMRVYKKSKEIKNSGKTYIEHYWKLNGVQDVTNMERLEITLRAKFCRQIFQHDYKCTTLAEILDLIMTNEFKASVLDTYSKGMYEFRLKDKSRKTACALSHNLYYVDNLRVSIIKLLSRCSRALSEGIYSTKLAIKQAYQVFIKTGNKKYYHYAKELAFNFHLNGYFKDRRPTWLYEVAHYIKRRLPFLEIFHAEKNYNEIKTKEFDLVKTNGVGEFVLKQIDHLQMISLNLQ